MPKFTVVYVKGRAVGRGPLAKFEPIAGKTVFTVETPTRIIAYMKACEHLAKFGMNVFVQRDQTGSGNPLGFTDPEINAAKTAGVPLDTEVKDGIRIEKIMWEL